MNPFDVGYYESEELRTFGFARVGENVRIAKNCVIVGVENIELGDNVRVDAFTTMIAARAKMRLLGANHIGGHAHLLAAADLTFGEFSGCSQGGKVYTASDDFGGEYLTGPCVPPESVSYISAPVTVGRHAVIGSGSVVLPGCSLGDGAILGALSVATRPLPPWGIYAGRPAAIIRARTQGLLVREPGIVRILAA